MCTSEIPKLPVKILLLCALKASELQRDWGGVKCPCCLSAPEQCQDVVGLK